MNLGLNGKVFMVAASSKGLGLGIASKLCEDGARVSLASRSKASIESVAAKMREHYGVDARGHTMDASDGSSIAAWHERTLEEFGRIDGLVVNAGGPPPGGFDSFDDAAWTKAFELTLLSAVRMIRCVLPTMRSQHSGAIVTVTSTSVIEPIDGLLLSNVFRAGVSSLVKSLSRELSTDGIRINNLVPGRIDTDRVRALDSTNAGANDVSIDEQRHREERSIPLGRYGTPIEFGAAAAFLLSDAAAYITGATLVVDGGKTRAL
jgi:3-oxoacyl-[acyl-carrier protein] reductase